MNIFQFKRLALMLAALFVAMILIEACAASRPGFNSSKRKGQKVHSTGSMYNKKKK